MQKIVLATNNAGKVQEFAHTMKKAAWQLVPQSEFNVHEIEETGLTFIENALIKARHATALTGLPAIGDDSGLIIDALNGEPGLYSARYAGINATANEHIEKVLKKLGNTAMEHRSARFYCLLVFLRHAHDQTPLIAEGIWEGRILLSPQGKKGFGYDPIFYVPTHNCSAAELSLTTKTELSHRGQAWQKLQTRLLSSNSSIS